MISCVKLLSFGSALFACWMLLPMAPRLAFHVAVPSRPATSSSAVAGPPRASPLLTLRSPPPCGAQQQPQLLLRTRLHLSSMLADPNSEEPKEREELWRVVLHKDDDNNVHTFLHVTRSLTKVVGGTLDRKAAFETCVEMYGSGKATVTKTSKKQAEQFCLGLQRQGLTVSVSPDESL